MYIVTYMYIQNYIHAYMCTNNYANPFSKENMLAHYRWVKKKRNKNTL